MLIEYKRFFLQNNFVHNFVANGLIITKLSHHLILTSNSHIMGVSIAVCEAVVTDAKKFLRPRQIQNVSPKLVICICVPGHIIYRCQSCLP